MILTLYNSAANHAGVALADHREVPTLEDAVNLFMDFGAVGDWLHINPHAITHDRLCLRLEGPDGYGRPCIADLHIPPASVDYKAFSGRRVGESLPEPEETRWLAQLLVPGPETPNAWAQVWLYRPSGCPIWRERLTVHAAFVAVRTWAEENLFGRDLNLALEALDAVQTGTTADDATRGTEARIPANSIKNEGGGVEGKAAGALQNATDFEGVRA